jgi:hypothetical protein
MPVDWQENAASGQATSAVQRGSVLRLFCFVLHDKSSQTVLAAYQEKDGEDHKEEYAFIIQTRYHKNSEKKKIQ